MVVGFVTQIILILLRALIRIIKSGITIIYTTALQAHDTLFLLSRPISRMGGENEKT